MRRPPRVLHLILRPRHSGAEALVRDLCREHVKSRTPCAIVSLAAPTPEFAVATDELRKMGIELFFPDADPGKLGRVRQAREAYDRFRPDAVFAHSVLPSLYGRLALPLFGALKPAFITVLHDASNDDFADGYLRALERLTRWRSDRIVAVSSEGARAYIKRFGDRPPVSVITNGIDIDRFRNADRRVAREMLGLTNASPKIILQVGRISQIKQQDLSIRALADLMKSEKIELWLAGLVEDESYERELRRLAADLKVQEQVRFLGSRSDVSDLMAAADLYVMPSTAEAHSIALLEALASGAPVVASDIETFRFCERWPGVRLVGVEDVRAFENAGGELLAAGGRFNRDLSEYAIERTAATYVAIANEASPSNRRSTDETAR